MSVSAQTHSFQVWTSIGTSVDLSKKLSLEFEAESRFQQTGALLKQASAELGLDYNITKHFFVGTSYKFADKYRKNGYFPVHTFAAIAGYKKKFGNLRIGYQNKMNLEKNTYIKKAEDVRPSFVDKNKIKLVYTGIDRLRPSVFVETYHLVGNESRYAIETIKYGINCGVEFRKQIGVNVGYMFRQEIIDRQNISIVTIALSKEL